ncbi:MAG: quinoprotein dehydrogenase-associated SoxYZ-like carrier [Thiotrichales bacterium]|nr:quinoprotein dehydrogenase-associated SoxYZ-like carrier [Thiotrichales bacterium]
MHERILDREPVIFDDRVRVQAPEFAEDPMNVPVSVQVDGIKNIEEIRVFADLNPIQHILNFRPIHVSAYIAFRFKVEQGTPVRAAVRTTTDGVWYVGGTWLDAAGGGCTAPSTGQLSGDWQSTLMNVTAKTRMNENEIERLRFRVMHPMDTGLAPGIPEFYLEKFSVIDERDRTIAYIETYQPVSENPVFSLDIDSASTRSVRLEGMDNNGNRLEARISR